jgi:hypothetical protein
MLLTQNVDRLHQAAGSREVIDLHGRLDRSAAWPARLAYATPAMLVVGSSGRGPLRGGSFVPPVAQTEPGLRPEILPDSTSKAGLKIGLTRLNLGRSPQSAQMRRFRSIHVRFVMRILGLAEVRRTRNVSKSASLTANNFANKLHGTEENGAALNATPHLDAPNVLGLFGPARYTPIRSRAYFKTGALNHSATLPNH